MPVIVHCPPDTYSKKETYIYGEVLTVKREFISRLNTRSIYTIRVLAYGGLEDPEWRELFCGEFVRATASSLELPHCYYRIYEYLNSSGTVQLPLRQPEQEQEEQTHGIGGLDSVNMNLRRKALRIQKREREGYVEEYKLGVLEPEWDE